MIFRFDDVGYNSDTVHIEEIVRVLQNRYDMCQVMLCISPLVKRPESGDSWVTRQRIFPKRWNALSNWRVFYEMDEAYVPRVLLRNIRGAVFASHGLIHVDHRLLCRGAQEMSILVSCSLVKTHTFVPPFNKYNADTEDICREHNIELVKFEEGWRCIEHEPFDASHDKWYLHAREVTVEGLERWFLGGAL